MKLGLGACEGRPAKWNQMPTYRAKPHPWGNCNWNRMKTGRRGPFTFPFKSPYKHCLQKWAGKSQKMLLEPSSSATGRVWKSRLEAARPSHKWVSHVKSQQYWGCCSIPTLKEILLCLKSGLAQFSGSLLFEFLKDSYPRQQRDRSVYCVPKLLRIILDVHAWSKPNPPFPFPWIS